MRGVLVAAHGDDPSITGQAKKATYQRKEQSTSVGGMVAQEQASRCIKRWGGRGGGGGGGLPGRMRGSSMVD